MLDSWPEHWSIGMHHFKPDCTKMVCPEPSLHSTGDREAHYWGAQVSVTSPMSSICLRQRSCSSARLLDLTTSTSIWAAKAILANGGTARSCWAVSSFMYLQSILP